MVLGTQQQRYYREVCDNVFRQLLETPEDADVWKGMFEGAFLGGRDVQSQADDLVACIEHRVGCRQYHAKTDSQIAVK